MSKKHMGSSIDGFLKQEGIFEETQAQAIKEVVAWQLAEAIESCAAAHDMTYVDLPVMWSARQIS